MLIWMIPCICHSYDGIHNGINLYWIYGEMERVTDNLIVSVLAKNIDNMCTDLDKMIKSSKPTLDKWFAVLYCFMVLSKYLSEDMIRHSPQAIMNSFINHIKKKWIADLT